MSKVKIEGNASGTGTLTIAAPNTNTDRSLTLPDEAGEVLVNGTTSNVGIGTSSPSQKLHITNSSSSGYATTRLTTDSRSFDVGLAGSATGWNQNNFYLYDVTAAAERMVVDSSGRVTKPYQPSFKAYTAGGQINSNNVALVFSDTSYGGGHNIGNHYNTSTGVFTAPVAGVYLFSVNMLTNPTFTSNSYVTAHWRINSTPYHYFAHNHNTNWVMEGSAIHLYLNANDTVDLYLSAGSGHYGSYSHFSGCLLS